MRESLRLRLVLWYALVLALVVALYGGAVVYQSWRSMVATVDAALMGYAREVGQALRPVEGGRFDLELPADASAYFSGREGDRPYYVITSASGELVDQSDPDLAASRGRQHDGSRREMSQLAAGGATVVVGRDIADLQRERRALIFNVALAGILTLAVSIFGGWFVAGRALAPIKRISQTAREMSAGDLHARIAVDRTESELEQVASTLNDAFDRLHLAVEQERRFTADASHELRTPISVLRAEAEWALDRERTPQQYKDALAVCRRAALRLQDAVERMLALVRAEAIDEVPEAAPVAVHAVIADVLVWLAPMAQEEGVRLTSDGGPLIVSGNAEQLREAFSNVVSNAILYNKPGGSVTVSTRQADRGLVEVIDTGIGIPSEAIPRIFDRFFRVDKARSREKGGSGLGLSIARAIFAAHGGDITCTSEAGTGSVFVISLPVFRSSPNTVAMT
jgi:two-component system OmpR family sensor kinase